MGWTLLVTVIAAVLYYLAKKKRDETGAVRTPEGYAFAVFAVLAVILWLGQILGSFC